MSCHALIAALTAGLASVGLGLAFFAALPLIGFGLLPRRALRLPGSILLPASLSLGALTLGWAVFVGGAVAGTWTALPLLGLLVGVSLRRLGRFVTTCQAALRHVRLLLVASWPLALLLVGLLLTLLPALLVPLNDSDGLRYHVALPKLYMLEGQVSFYPYDSTGGYPQCGEMLYLLGLQLGSGEASKILHCLFFLATLATLALLVHRDRSSRLAAVAAPWLLAAAPLAITPAAAAFVDHISLLHVAVGLLAWRRRAPAWLVGVALAGAATAKITSAPAVVAIALAVVVTARKGSRLASAAGLAVPIGLAWLPFAVRNLASTGDPFFPLARLALGLPVPVLAPEMQQWVAHFHADVPGWLGIPWGTALAPTYPDEVAGWYHLAGLAGLVLAVVDRRVRAFGLLIAAYGVLGCWVQPPTRLLLPAFLALAATEGALLARMPRWLAALLAVALALPSAVGSARLLNRDPRRWEYFAGRITRSGFLAATVPGYEATRAIAAMGPGGRIMALDFPAPYYFDRPWIAEGLLNEPPLRLWLDAGASAEELLNRLQAMDVRWLVVTPRFGGGSAHPLLPLARSPAQLATLVQLKDLLASVWSQEGIVVLEVPRQPSGAATRAVGGCLLGSAPERGADPYGFDRPG